MNGRTVKTKIKILDSNKKPLVNREISFVQQSHEFLFGCNAFDFLSEQMVSEENHKKFLAERNAKWLEIFNFGTLPFYWGAYESEEGITNKDAMMKAAKKLQSNNVILKGHPLCWHTVCASWLLKYDTETIFQKQMERIKREVSDFKGIIDIWDAINEVVILPHFNRYDNAVSRLEKKYGQVDLVKSVFDEAQKYNQNGIFLLNDFNTSSDYADLIEKCLNAGVKIDAIGIQSHQHQGAWSMEKLEEVLSRFEKFNLPIHFTENTMVSGRPVPPEIQDLNDFQYDDDASTPEFEEKQKNDMEKFYRAIFENHPQVKAITNWDFCDGAWLNAPSGLLRRDNSEKPVYKMLKKLIKNEWWTNLTLKTDKNGFVKVEGFKGKYIISCENKTSEKFVLEEKDLEIIL